MASFRATRRADNISEPQLFGLTSDPAMSSNEDDIEGDGLLHGSKKRRIQRACDICRRKKSVFICVLHHQSLYWLESQSDVSFPILIIEFASW